MNTGFISSAPSCRLLQTSWELQNPGVLAELVLPRTAPKHDHMGPPMLVLQHDAGMAQPAHRPVSPLQHTPET